MDQELQTELLAGSRRTLLHMQMVNAAGARRTLHVHSPDCSTFPHEMTSWPPSWKCHVISNICFCQSMRIYLRNIPTKFHPDPIWNDGALGFVKNGRPNNNKKNKMSSDMGQFLIPIILQIHCVSKKRARNIMPHNSRKCGPMLTLFFHCHILRWSAVKDGIRSTNAPEICCHTTLGKSNVKLRSLFTHITKQKAWFHNI